MHFAAMQRVQTQILQPWGTCGAVPPLPVAMHFKTLSEPSSSASEHLREVLVPCVGAVTTGTGTPPARGGRTSRIKRWWERAGCQPFLAARARGGRVLLTPLEILFRSKGI